MEFYKYISVFIVFILCNGVHVLGLEVQTNQETRIVGGVQANRNEFPWLVRIQRKSSKSLLCGGAIIKNNIILTAAHCFSGTGINPTGLEIVAGDHDATVNEGTEQTLNIKQVIVHENYNSNTFANDICILRLSSNFTLGTAVNVINIPPQGYVLPANVTVAGWGVTTVDGTSTPAVLRKVSLPIVPNNVCASQYSGIVAISSKMLCAGIATKDSCQGDSGGPLMCTSGSGTVSCGVVSFGVGCGRPGYSGVYTRNSEYGAWISANSADSDNLTDSPNSGNKVGFQMFPSLIALIILYI